MIILVVIFSDLKRPECREIKASGNTQAVETQNGMTLESWSSTWFALLPISLLQHHPWAFWGISTVLSSIYFFSFPQIISVKLQSFFFSMIKVTAAEKGWKTSEMRHVTDTWGRGGGGKKMSARQVMRTERKRWGKEERNGKKVQLSVGPDGGGSWGEGKSKMKATNAERWARLPPFLFSF